MVSLKSKWRRMKSPALSESVMKMSRRNYRVYVYMGTTEDIIMQSCAVLDNRAGPNFFNRKQQLESGVKLKIGGSTNISDANRNTLQIVGKLSLFVSFGSYVVKCDLYVCESLATESVLGGDVFDIFSRLSSHGNEQLNWMTAHRFALYENK